MSAYYNEFDPFAAAWLRELIKAGHIAHGIVDERSIEDVKPDEVMGYTQCHFFAGIGGWSLALKQACWPDDKPVWTGSSPCQPFSTAGKGKGTSDERHLWPAFYHLVSQCRPPVIFGEQVEAAIKHGWLDTVQADMEATGYAFGSASIAACAVGAHHIRKRLWFVGELGNSIDTRSQGLGWDGNDCDESRRIDTQQVRPIRQASRSGFWDNSIWIPCRDGKVRAIEPTIFPLAHGIPNRVGLLRGAGNAIVPPLAKEFITAYMDTKK